MTMSDTAKVQSDSKRNKQEAQLPLRNRALATYFFVAKLLSIAVMTCRLQLRLSPSKPTSDDPANLRVRRTQLSACDHSTRAHGTRPHCRLMSLFLENPCGHPHKLYIARN